MTITMDMVKGYVEKMLAHAKECSSADMVMNCRAQAFGVIMFAQNFIPYRKLEKYWESDGGIWYKFNDIAKEKNR